MQKRTFTVRPIAIYWLLLFATGTLIVYFAPEIIAILPSELGNHNLTPNQLQGLEWVSGVLLVSGIVIFINLCVKRKEPQKQVEQKEKYLTYAKDPDEIVASLVQEQLRRNGKASWEMNTHEIEKFIDERIGLLRSLYRQWSRTHNLLVPEEEGQLWSDQNLKNAAKIIKKQRGRVILLPLATRRKQKHDEKLSI